VVVHILVEVTIVKMRAVRVPIRLTVAPAARMFSDSATVGLANSSFSIKEKARQGRPAYLDFQATTPMDPRVLDAMMPYMISRYGNPHSRTHSYGWDTEKAVETAREDVASIIGASSKEIIFTSGATESNNLAIKGVARFYKGKKNHVITSQTEHKCVLDSCRALESEGFEVTYLPVQQNGIISLDDLKAAIRPTTVLLSIMGVNNEIGVLQPLKQIGEVFMTVM
jgi:cysteine desulfurase